MTKYCNLCHAPNKNRARSCQGCEGRFSGQRSNSTMFDALVRDPDELLAARADGRAPRARQRTPVPAPLPPATRGFSAGAWNWRLRRAVVVGAAGLLALSAGLTVWQRGRSETQRAAHVQVQVAPSAALAQPHVRLS